MGEEPNEKTGLSQSRQTASHPANQREEPGWGDLSWDGGHYDQPETELIQEIQFFLACNLTEQDSMKYCSAFAESRLSNMLPAV